MARKVTIDVEARFIDNVTDEAKAAAKSFGDLERAAEDAQKDLKKLGKTKVNADTSAAEKKLRGVDRLLSKLGKSKAEAVLSVLDKATATIDKVTSKAKAFAGKTYSALFKLRDSNVLGSLNKMSSAIKSLTGKAWSVAVKIKDTFTAPLTKLKNMLFSVKTLVAGIAGAWAVKQAVISPINVADAYSSAKIGFSTLLGEEGGQKMMDDLDEFAKKTPFKTSGVIANAQKMMAMGWDPADIIEDMEVIGNAAAATGKMDQGLESIVRALSQIKTKGKLSTEELNQLAEAGIAAKAMLAEGLGYGTGDKGIAAMTQDLERGAIQSDVAIQALIAGMHKYDGMMDSMANETVEGLISQMQDVFEINILRKWGQGLQDGAKRGFGTVVQLLDESEESLSKVGDMLYDLGKTASNWAADKLQGVVDKILEISGSSDFKNASLKDKMKMMWKGIVADPFNEWLDEVWSGEESIAKATDFGRTLAEKITDGILAVLGVSDIFGKGGLSEEAGENIAQGFAKGFVEGFDVSAITDKLAQAIGNVWSALPWWAKTLVGVYGAGKVAGGISSFAGGIINAIGSPAALGADGAMVAGTGLRGLLGGNVVNAAGDVIGATGLRGLIGSTGNAMVGGTGILGWLANAGYALTGGTAAAAGMSGAAAAGLGASGIAGGLGVLSGLFDIWKGIRSSGKQAKDNYFQGGSKIGLVGTGAAAGAAIGSIIPGAGTAAGALVGAGIGGLGALFGGDKLGKWLSDLTDDMDGLKESITEFFTVTIPEKWNGFWDGVGQFFSETVPYALGYAAGKVTVFFTETLPEKWNGFWESVGNFFTETIPAWASDVWNNSIVPFWEETLPGLLPSLWDSVTGFFTEDLPSIGSTIWSAISSFFTVTIPGWAKSAMDSVSSWWGGVKESFGSGFDAGAGKKARGGIIGGESAMDAFARGGIVGGSTRFIRVNEESPEMIIPLSDQRRDRALKLWAKTGNLLGVPGFARGGIVGGDGSDEGIRFNTYGSRETAGGRTMQINLGGVKLEIHVGTSDREGIIEAIKAQAGELADYIVGQIADALETEFENTPVRGGVA